MVEIMENELRVDSAILRNATDEEMDKLREITKMISSRAQGNEVKHIVKYFQPIL